MNTTFQMLQNYSALEHILLGDLRDLLEEPADKQNARWMLAVLDMLLDTLPREFDLEEADGYLQVVLEAHPYWDDQVDRLQAEHSLLFQELKELRNRIADQQDYSRIAGTVRSDLRNWMQLLIAHNRNENRLVQTALNLEIGCH